MSGPDVVRLSGPALRPLVEAIGSLSAVDLGRYAIVGGVAVAARLGRPHRVTNDVDTVVDQDRIPAAVDVLRALPQADLGQSQGHRVIVQGTKIELIEVGPVPGSAELNGVDPLDRLFALAHAWALTTATPLTVIHTDDAGITVTAEFASPAALLAMKLHAIQDRSGEGAAKRRSDAQDILELLTVRQRDIASSLREAPEALFGLVRDAVGFLLVAGAPRTRSWLGAGPSGYSVEEISHLGRALLADLGQARAV